MTKKFVRTIVSTAAALALTITAAVSVFAEQAGEEPRTCCGGGAAVTGQLSDAGFAAQLYNADNGLPTSDANAILASSDGFIWIGGYSGLIRYDGSSFERQDSSGGITNANTVFEDSRHRLWVGTNDNGIVVKDRDSETNFNYTSGLRSSSIRAITEDGSGNIVVGTTQGMFYVDSDLNFHELNDPQLDNLYILGLVSDTDGSIYGNARNGAFFRIKDLRLTDYYNSSDLGIDYVSTIFPDPEKTGSVYLGTELGRVCRGSYDDNFRDLTTKTIHYDKRTFVTDDDGNIVSVTNETAELTDAVNCIGYASGRIWVVTDKMIFYTDENGEFVELENIPMTSEIECMDEDYEGNLWFASSRQGIMKIVENKFTDVTAQSALENTVVNTTCLHNGLLYIGTDSGLELTDCNGHKVENDITDYFGNTRIRCITEDKSGNLWFSTYSNDMGLVCVTADGKTVQYTEKNGLLSNKTRCTVIAPDGKVLEATNGGLVVIENGKIEKCIGAESGLSNTVILTAEVTDDGRYYLGTDGNGIYVIDGNKISRIGREDGLTSDIILRIKKDPERGVYWIITSNSIEYIKDDEIHKVSGGFPYTNNYDIFFDRSDNVWVLSSNGLYVVNAHDLIEKENFDYHYYGVSDGLPSVPTGNSFSYLDENGDLYISGRTGVSRVNIDKYFDQTHDIKFSVPYIEANDIKYYPDQQGNVTLPSSANTITIYGYALTYSMHDPEIEYCLVGADETPVRVSKSDMKPVRYTNLAGGSYEFRLSMINNSTHDIQQTMTLNIVKVKAFYEEIWFYVVCIIIGLAIIAVIVTTYVGYKTKAFLEKERENKIIIRDMCEAFAKTIDAKDNYTNGHSKRVAYYTTMLTRELGYDEDTIEKYHNIALLHDIGKIGVPMEVLNKPGKLTDEEFAIIKSHTTIGYNVLKDISIMPELATGAGLHHERPDGKGYPNGLSGDEIPRVAQIIAVADTFDAMYSNRPYRKRMNFEKVCSIISEVSGTQLESDVVDAFMRLVEKGEFRAPNDNGGGSMEDINNIHKSFENKPEEAQSQENEKKPEASDEKDTPKPDAPDEKDAPKEEKTEQ